jgi:hypothetical protein
MGQGGFKYESVNSSSFAKPNMSVSVAKAEVDEIVNRISADNVTYKSGPQDGETIRAYFKTNSSSCYQAFGRVQKTIDPAQT